MPGDVEHVVDASDDPKIAIFVLARAIAGEVTAFDFAPVNFFESLRITPDAAQHAGPWFSDDELATGVARNCFAFLVDDFRNHAEKWQSRRAWLGWGHTGKRRDHDDASLSLPPGIDDRTASPANALPVPNPSLGIDRFPNGSKKTQRTEIVFFRPLSAPLHKGANGSRCSVKYIDPILGDDPPKTVRLRPVRRAF